MRRSRCIAALLAALVPVSSAIAASPVAPVVPVVPCIEAAANIHRLPPAVLVILLSVEGGTLGAVSRNSNGTVDIGPMQVNQDWLPEVARHWRASQTASFAALRDSFCANVEAGAWILRQAIDEAHGDFWAGVGLYHSHDPGYRAEYLRRVLHQTLRLQAMAARGGSTEPGS